MKTIPAQSNKEYNFRPCTCGTKRRPRVNRDFLTGFTVYCPNCGLTTLPETEEFLAVSGWDNDDVRMN